MNDLFHREDQVYKPLGLLVLPHRWLGKDWAGPFFFLPKCFGLSIYLSVFFLDYATVSLYLNTSE